MEVVTEVFAARRDELVAAFRGWLSPLPTRVQRHLHNPFSGEPMFRSDGRPWMIDTNAPLGPWPADIRCPNLEEFSRTRITPLYQADLCTLARVLGLAVDCDFEGALFTPPGNGRFLWSLPEVLGEALARVTDVGPTAETWKLTPRDNLDDDHGALDPDHFSSCLTSLVALARRAMTQELRLLCYQGPEPHV